MAQGGTGCLWAVAAAALTVEEPIKLSVGQPPEVVTPHQIQSVLDMKGHRRLSGGRLAKSQALLQDSPEVTLRTSQTLTPANPIPLPVETHEIIDRKCVEVTEQVYSSRSDLKKAPLDNTDKTEFTDGSRIVYQATWKTAYAIASLTKIAKAKAIPGGTSAPKGRINCSHLSLPITRWAESDFKYAVLVSHTHAAIWKEWGFLTAKHSPIMCGEEILKLLKAVQAPKEIAVIHCRGHQKGETESMKGNCQADALARKPAPDSCSIMALIPDSESFSSQPEGSTEEGRWALKWCFQMEVHEFFTKQGKLLISRPMQWKLLRDYMKLPTWEEVLKQHRSKSSSK